MKAPVAGMLALLALAAVAPAALAQSAADCARSVPNCATCRFQFYRGTVTRAICLSCTAGYRVASSGRACWCAPGFAYNSTSGACGRCGTGSWCPGARSTQASATRTACGTNKVTSTDVAMSDRECVVNPGYGWAAGSSSAICPVGTFNPGYNQRTCSKCQGGMTTTGTGSTSPQACQAPAGYYFLAGKAVACAQGTYKATVGNADCSKCPEGFTTAPGAVGKTAGSDCSFLLPGYSAGSGATLGTTPGTKCAADTYRVGTTAYSGSAISCTGCPTGMATLTGVEGATSKDACLAPPGYGWSAGSQTATICAIGSYNPGWNREACRACDASSGSITTLATGSSGADDCYVPAGHGSVKTADGAYTGAACPADTYGRLNNTFGLVEVTCDKCLEHTSTSSATGSTSSDACVTDAGYGYDDGQVNQCEYGTWAAGGNVAACSECGEGYNTTADGATPTTTAVVGASASTQCAVAAGWTYADAADGTKGIAPCTRGAYKALIGNASCTTCPSGTTTTITMAAVAQSDCDACRPGFGKASINLSSPSCDICTTGTYSAGYTTGGAACSACPKPSLFTGTMVSREGIFTPEDCVPEFPTDGNQPSYLPWDAIPMNASLYLTVQAAITTSEDCQAACKADAKCQYFVYYNYNITTGSQTQCFLRLAASNIAKLAGSDPTAYTSTVLFEVKEGQYAVYAATDAFDADNIGSTLSSGLAWAAAKAYCDGTPACIGLAVGATPNTFRAFTGIKWEGATGKVRVVGETINSWIATPTP